MTRDGFNHDFGLRDQIRKRAVSIAGNLAEGDERGTNKDSVRFFYMAKGSLAELRTHVQIASEIGRVQKSAFDSIEMECEQLGKMIGSLIRVRRRTYNPLPRTPNLHN